MMYFKQKAKHLLKTGYFGFLLAMAIVIGFSTVVRGEGVVVFPSEVRPGDSIVISGQGFPANQTLTITLESTGTTADLGTAKTDSQGGFSTQIFISIATEAGNYLLKVTGNGNSSTTAVNVLKESDSSSSGSILGFERTTGEIIIISLIILVSIAVGIILISFARKPAKS